MNRQKTDVLEKSANTSLTYEWHVRFQTWDSRFSLNNNTGKKKFLSSLNQQSSFYAVAGLDYFPEGHNRLLVSDGKQRILLLPLALLLPPLGKMESLRMNTNHQKRCVYCRVLPITRDVTTLQVKMAHFFLNINRNDSNSKFSDVGELLVGLPSLHVTFLDSFWFSGVSQGKLGLLQAEVKKNCEILPKLSSDLSIILLKAFKAVMRDRTLFQELSQRVSKVVLLARIYKYRDMQDHTSCPRRHLSGATTINPKTLHSAHLSGLQHHAEKEGAQDRVNH